ncbi:hypothetical protein M5K25_014355 [Dendrobium thyrsiflorum]|uniref:Uncharacterized protein n=1 Tax=Dendrobium thyrsiflorum TaxID=117978 RepID=A0ABD0UW19_DENTH
MDMFVRPPGPQTAGDEGWKDCCLAMKLAKEIVRTIVGGPVKAWGHLKAGQTTNVTWRPGENPASLGGLGEVWRHLEAGRNSGVAGGRGEVRRHLDAGRNSGVAWRPGGSPASLGGRAEVRRRLEAGGKSGVTWRPGGIPASVGGRGEVWRPLEAGRNSGVAWRPGGSPASLGGRAELRRRLEAGGKSGVTWRPGGTPASLGGRGEVRRHLEAGRNSGIAWRPGGSPASLGGRAELRRRLEAGGGGGGGGRPASLGGRTELRRRRGLINNNFEASRVCRSSFHFVVAVRLRCFAGGVEIARVATLAPSWLFGFAPSTTFPSCRVGSYDILIGSINGSLLAVKVLPFARRLLSFGDAAPRKNIRKYRGELGTGAPMIPNDRSWAISINAKTKIVLKRVSSATDTFPKGRVGIAARPPRGDVWKLPDEGISERFASKMKLLKGANLEFGMTFPPALSDWNLQQLTSPIITQGMKSLGSREQRSCQRLNLSEKELEA